MRALASFVLIAAAVASMAQFYGPGKYDRTVPGQGRIASGEQSGVRVDQKLGDKLPMNLEMKDETGREVRLGELFRGRPVLLLPIFFECPGICTQELNGLADALSSLKAPNDEPGKNFDVLIFSIEPKETPQMAAAKKETYVGLYEDMAKDKKAPRESTEDGWRFLTATPDVVEELTQAIGFNYRRDEKGNIVHPAALVVATPEGVISRYFLTTEYAQRILQASIQQAAGEQVGERQQPINFLSCITLDPMTGQVSVNILNTVRLGGILTMAILAVSLFVMNRSRKRKLKTLENKA
jgi:protein SCO1/2